MRGSQTKITAISVGTTPVVILASNVNRVRAMVANDAGTLFVTYGNFVPSAALYSHRIVANDERLIEHYTGLLNAVKASGTSLVFVTEIW